MKLRGFSLIEIAIGITIIGLINMLLVPKLVEIVGLSKETVAKSNARSIMVSLEEYYFIHQSYPTGVGVSIQDTLTQLNNGGVQVSNPLNPYTGEAYSGNDASGLLLYTLESDQTYSMTLYGNNNDNIIFEYP